MQFSETHTQLQLSQHHKNIASRPCELVQVEASVLVPLVTASASPPPPSILPPHTHTHTHTHTQTHTHTHTHASPWIGSPPVTANPRGGVCVCVNKTTTDQT